jgi:hypothetical protein
VLHNYRERVGPLAATDAGLAVEKEMKAEVRPGPDVKYPHVVSSLDVSQSMLPRHDLRSSGQVAALSEQARVALAEKIKRVLREWRDQLSSICGKTFSNLTICVLVLREILQGSRLQRSASGSSRRNAQPTALFRASLPM